MDDTTFYRHNTTFVHCVWGPSFLCNAHHFVCRPHDQEKNDNVCILCQYTYIQNNRLFWRPKVRFFCASSGGANHCNVSNYVYTMQRWMFLHVFVCTEEEFSLLVLRFVHEWSGADFFSNSADFRLTIDILLARFVHRSRHTQARNITKFGLAIGGLRALSKNILTVFHSNVKISCFFFRRCLRCTRGSRNCLRCTRGSRNCLRCTRGSRTCSWSRSWTCSWSFRCSSTSEGRATRSSSEDARFWSNNRSSSEDARSWSTTRSSSSKQAS